MYRNKNIVITGASSGLGKELALAFLSQNANLLLCGKNEQRVQSLESLLLKKYPQGKFKCLCLDISQEQSNRILWETSKEFLGETHMLIANAGQSMWCKFLDLENLDDAEKLMQLNFMAVVYGAYYFLPELKKTKGSFVAISSIQGAFPTPYHSLYAASKYAVNGFMDALRMEEPDIHFFTAMPSWIAGTSMRQNALKSSHGVKVNSKHEKSVMTAKECAEIIIKAISKKKNELFIPQKFALIPFLRFFAKNLVDKFIVKKVNTQLNKSNNTNHNSGITSK